jgi:hypothetical protein
MDNLLATDVLAESSPSSSWRRGTQSSEEQAALSRERHHRWQRAESHDPAEELFLGESSHERERGFAEGEHIERFGTVAWACCAEGW